MKNKQYYLLKDFGCDGYSLEEFDTIQEAIDEMEREQIDSYQTVLQYRIFPKGEENNDET